MPFAKDNDVVEALTSDGADQPLRISILPGRMRRDRSVANAHGANGEMSIANPLWGAPRIHGELLKLGIAVGQTTVAKYMAKRRRPPSQGWKTFLHNHADGIASMDLFVVPTISFRRMYALLILQHARRELLWLAVTAHPTAEWMARQVTEAFGWREVTGLSGARSRPCLRERFHPAQNELANFG